MQTFKTSKARENILRKIRVALQDEELPVPYPEIGQVQADKLFQGFEMDTPEENFALQFQSQGGRFVFCETLAHLVENLKILAESRGWSEVMCADKTLFAQLIDHKLSFIREYNPANDTVPAVITDCEAAVARTGSFFFSSRQYFGRTAPVYFPVHLVILTPSQIVSDIGAGLTFLKQKYPGQLPSMINLNTGPSRTADIEKTLVTGVHGPKEVFCFFLNQ